MLDRSGPEAGGVGGVWEDGLQRHSFAVYRYRIYCGACYPCRTAVLTVEEFAALNRHHHESLKRRSDGGGEL